MHIVAMVRGLPSRIVLSLLWLLTAVVGTWATLRYQITAGRSGPPPEQWSQDMEIPLSKNGGTLLMFAHPKCPCTRSSISELNRLLARTPQRIAAHVFFLKPSEFGIEGARTDLWHSAAAIPGVTVHEDVDGKLARRFGAETSGYVVLYNAQGQLQFHGGITAGRGHVGDNAGVDEILKLSAEAGEASQQSPVYGCPLTDKNYALPDYSTACSQ